MAEGSFHSALEDLMKILRKAIALAGILALGATPVRAEEFGSPAKGLEYARAVCAECHAVERPVAQSPNRAAPSFVTVAKTRGMTAMAIRAWLQSAHPTMPNFLIKTEDRDNLIAYILGLKSK
jgi:mono/diheme cytochrome c family protein